MDQPHLIDALEMLRDTSERRAEPAGAGTADGRHPVEPPLTRDTTQPARDAVYEPEIIRYAHAISIHRLGGPAVRPREHADQNDGYIAREP